MSPDTTLIVLGVFVGSFVFGVVVGYVLGQP